MRPRRSETLHLYGRMDDGGLPIVITPNAFLNLRGNSDEVEIGPLGYGIIPLAQEGNDGFQHHTGGRGEILPRRVALIFPHVAGRRQAITEMRGFTVFTP